MANVFFTADHHFGHANILQFCDRPWSSIDEHDAALIELWNAVVQPDDVVWHLGDFVYRGDKIRARRIFEKLNGSKHLIFGNHDKPFVRELGWASVGHYAEVAVDKQRLVLFHYSMRVWNAQRRGAVQLYGHSHGTLPGNSRSLDVGVDCWGYAPVTWPQIAERLATLPEWLPQEHDAVEPAAAVHP